MGYRFNSFVGGAKTKLQNYFCSTQTTLDMQIVHTFSIWSKFYIYNNNLELKHALYLKRAALFWVMKGVFEY